MIGRFFAYAVLRNLRFFDAFVMLFFLYDLGLGFGWVGALLAYEKVLTGALEVPSGVVADRLGRRRSLVMSFVLAAVAMVGFALSGHVEQRLAAVAASLTLYAVAESFRTGTHKAIILDWLTQSGQPHRKVEVIGKARTFSKTSDGLSALIGGVLVWRSGGFEVLFWAAAIPTVLCAMVLASYPKELEGEASKPSPRPALSRWERIKSVFERPGLAALLIPSIVFESQLKLAKHYLQPAVADVAGALGFEVEGGAGALGVGAYLFVLGLFAGAASLTSGLMVRLAGSASRALGLAYWVGCLLLVAGAALLAVGQGWLGLGLMLCIGALQNGRRPIFLAEVDEAMDPRYRATTLSVESQARRWLYALTALISGLLAEHAGLWTAFALMGGLMLLGLGLRPSLRRHGRARSD